LSSERGGEGLAWRLWDSQSLGDPGASSPDYPQERTVGNNRHASKKESPKRAHYEGPREGLLGPASTEYTPERFTQRGQCHPGPKNWGPGGEALRARAENFTKSIPD